MKLKFPKNLFFDPDNDVLSYLLKYNKNNDLPYWVTFYEDELEAVFFPVNTTLQGNHTFKLVASDEFGESVSD